MSVRVTGAASCRAMLREVEALISSKAPMQGVVEDVKALVLERTAAGHDYLGRNFEPYSDSYKKRRKEKGLQTKPNLEVTGTMLGALRTEVLTPRHGRVEVAPESDGRINADVLANIHTTGTGRMPKREFMNIAKSALDKFVKKHFDDPILAIMRKYR